MPVPSSFDDLSTTPSSNSPAGSESVGTQANEYLQAAFAFIAQLHSGYTPLNTLTAPVGTRIVMQQAAAPTGWTVDTSAAYTDVAMRFNQAVSTGGTSAFSAWSAGGTFNSSAVALTVAQMPSHNHPMNDPGHNHAAPVTDGGHTHVDSGHQHAQAGDTYYNVNGAGAGGQGSFTIGQASRVTGVGNAQIQAANANISVSITSSGTGVSTQAVGSGATHQHTLTYQPKLKYADCIVAVKS